MFGKFGPIRFLSHSCSLHSAFSAYFALFSYSCTLQMTIVDTQENKIALSLMAEQLLPINSINKLALSLEHNRQELALVRQRSCVSVSQCLSEVSPPYCLVAARLSSCRTQFSLQYLQRRQIYHRQLRCYCGQEEQCVLLKVAFLTYLFFTRF